MKIVTFNIRIECSPQVQHINDFVHRAGGILMKIDAEDPDIICFQEATELIKAFLRRHLPGYTFLGHGREADLAGESCIIAVKTDLFDVICCDTFWLSDTPDLPGSLFAAGQSKFPRICTTAKLLRRSDKKAFALYNTHLDFFTQEVALNGMKLILARLQKDQQQAPMPFFLTGDLNSTPDSPAIRYAKSFSAPELVDLTDRIPITDHNFGKTASKIDYIFSDTDTAKSLQSVSVWDECHAGIYLSDHYPVCAQLNF